MEDGEFVDIEKLTGITCETDFNPLIIQPIYI